MNEDAFKLPVMQCKRCPHKWIPRITPVRMCPKCKSLRWDTPRKNKKEK